MKLRQPGHNRRCASVKALQEIKDVTPEKAKLIRAIWRDMTRDKLIETFPSVAEYVRTCFNPPGTRELRELAIDNTLDTCGIEYLGVSRKTGDSVTYCNTGDTNALTVMFFGPDLRLGCMGDVIESGLLRRRVDL
jgi:hypothetical protein